MSIGLASIVGFLLGGGFGFVLYFTVFIFTDAIDSTSKIWDVEESYIFISTMFIGAIAGCGLGAWLAHSYKSRLKTTAQFVPSVSEDGLDVWPPTPRV